MEKMATEKDRSELIMCSLHSNQTLELFCKDHEAVLCKMCKLLKHRRCNVEIVTDALKPEGGLEKFKEVPVQIMKLREELMTSNAKFQSLLDQNKEETSDAERNIETIRKGLNGVLDRYKEQLKAQLISNTETLGDTMQTYENLSSQLENQACTLEDAKGKGLRETLCLIEANQLLKECKDVKNEIDKERKQFNIKIREDEMLPGLLQQLIKIGQREVTDSEEAVDGACNRQDTSFLNIKSCVAVQESEIKLPTDRKVSNITGCCFLSDEEVMICDYYNRTLKLLDRDLKLRFTVLCSQYPNKVARFDDSSIVVLYSGRFQLVCTKPGIKLGQEKETGMSCYGLESLNKMIYISTVRSENRKPIAGVAEFTKAGDMTKFIPLVGSGITSIGSHLSVNIKNGSTYFVVLVESDNGYFINKLSSSGHGILSVSTDSLKKPKSIINDSVGNLLICDTDTKSVHIIDSEGQVGNIILTEKGDFGPTSMCLNASKDTLVVASTQKDSSKITVYKLTYD